jgi:hypothetical protein
MNKHLLAHSQSVLSNMDQFLDFFFLFLIFLFYLKFEENIYECYFFGRGREKRGGGGG